MRIDSKVDTKYIRGIQRWRILKTIIPLCLGRICFDNKVRKRKNELEIPDFFSHNA